jgi:hypothetical protein
MCSTKFRFLYKITSRRLSNLRHELIFQKLLLIGAVYDGVNHIAQPGGYGGRHVPHLRNSF